MLESREYMKKWFILFVVLGLIACNQETVETNNHDQQSNMQEPIMIELDYSKMDEAVAKVSKDMNYQIDLPVVEDIHKMELTDFFSVEKTAFRMNVENEIANVLVHADVEKKAEEQVKGYLQTLTLAEKEYGVTITQAEVTTFIDQYIAPAEIEEKNHFANALGISREELDHLFDRDFYIMDALYEKLISVLQEKYPDLSLEEMKEQFYIHS